MYSESLMTPHPRKSTEALQQPLEEALQLDQVREGLEALSRIDIERYEIAKQEVVDVIATQVNKALWFPMYSDPKYPEDALLPNPLPLDSITSIQTTDCFGYTLVASECLEKASVDHWVAYANGHAFLLVPFSGGKTYFMDALSPGLNGFVENALERGDQEAITRQIAESKRAVVMLNTQTMGSLIGKSADTIAEKHPWFTKKEFSGSRGVSEKDPSHSRYQSKYKLIMTAFDPKDGRNSIRDYVSYDIAMSANDIGTARDAMLSMSGVFLNADARQDHTEVRSLVRKLCVTDPESAAKVAETYFDSNFKNLHDSRIHEAKGDVFRVIARMAGMKSAAERASAAYQEAVKMPHSFTAAVLGKLSVAQSLAKEL